MLYLRKGDITRFSGDVIVNAGCIMAAAYVVPCRGVIHAVGPRWLFGAYAKRQDGLLAQAYLRALRLARDNGFLSIAFPCISTGHYFYPHERVAGITLRTIITYLVNTPDMDVYCFCFSRRDLLIYRRIQEESHHSFLTDDA
ncbi:TPA: macro domain-containing protein [Salmonella enterica subsp. enterica serovar Muenchen]